MDWHILQPALQQYLSCIINLPSITRLEISDFRVFPINIFIPCINLTDLTIISIESAVMDNSEHEYFASDAVSQLQSFTSSFISGESLKNLVEARRSKDVPVLDFSNLRALSLHVEKLETIHYSGLYQTYLSLYAGTKC